MIELSHVSLARAAPGRRPLLALDDVSLRVGAGEVVGLAGPATSGKSRVLALVLGHERPTSGTVRVDGIEPRRFVEREGMGYLPQGLGLPASWRTAEALRRLAILSGVVASALRDRTERAMVEFELTAVRRARVRKLDSNTRMRLGLAQTLLADHRVLVLDEPLEDTPPESLEHLRSYVTRVRAFDRAVLVASRDTIVLQELADRVVHIDRGRVRDVVVTRPKAPTPAGMRPVERAELGSSSGR